VVTDKSKQLKDWKYPVYLDEGTMKNVHLVESLINHGLSRDLIKTKNILDVESFDFFAFLCSDSKEKDQVGIYMIMYVDRDEKGKLKSHSLQEILRMKWTNY